MKKHHKIASIVVLASVVTGVLIVGFEKVQSYVAAGIKDSQKLRVVESNTCDSTRTQKPHFGGCSSIL
jgi:hypothetical protein